MYAPFTKSGSLQYYFLHLLVIKSFKLVMISSVYKVNLFQTTFKNRNGSCTSVHVKTSEKKSSKNLRLQQVCTVLNYTSFVFEIR